MDGVYIISSLMALYMRQATHFKGLSFIQIVLKQLFMEESLPVN